MDHLQSVICDTVDKRAKDLHNISQGLWDNPELAFEEHKAHALLTDFLEKEGFIVHRAYKGLETAFCAEFGSSEDGPHVCVICEYDALPGIGHACGHNLIAEAGIAAGLALKSAMEKSEKPLGKLTILGTPAEEGGGGKNELIARYAFNSFDVAMMVHPVYFDHPRLHCLCIMQWYVRYKGRSVHASACPWEGNNALDAAVLAYQNISCMRQQMKPDWRVHGIFTKAGEKPNIIPDEAELHYYLRAPTASELLELKAKADACFKAAASATGCEVEIVEAGPPYLNLISNGPLEASYAKHAESLGVVFDSEEVAFKLKGSTDMGNVSFVVPSIHPVFGIGAGADAVNHSKDFTAAVGDPIAQSYTLKQGKAMALAGLDVLRDASLLAKIKERFQSDLKDQGAEKLRSMIGYKD